MYRHQIIVLINQEYSNLHITMTLFLHLLLEQYFYDIMNIVLTCPYFCSFYKDI